MNRASFSALLICASLTGGCARLLDSRYQADLQADATREAVLSAAAAELAAREYDAHRPQPNRLHASQSQFTLMTYPAIVAGLAATPAFLVTWPLVGLVSSGETAMWWPVIPWSIPDGATIHRSIELVTMAGPGSSTTIRITAKGDRAGIRDAKALTELLMRSVDAKDVSPAPSGNTR